MYIIERHVKIVMTCVYSMSVMMKRDTTYLYISFFCKILSSHLSTEWTQVHHRRCTRSVYTPGFPCRTERRCTCRCHHWSRRHDTPPWLSRLLSECCAVFHVVEHRCEADTRTCHYSPLERTKKLTSGNEVSLWAFGKEQKARVW